MNFYEKITETGAARVFLMMLCETICQTTAEINLKIGNWQSAEKGQKYRRKGKSVKPIIALLVEDLVSFRGPFFVKSNLEC